MSWEVTNLLILPGFPTMLELQVWATTPGFLFWAKSHSTAQTGFELWIFLPHPPEEQGSLRTTAAPFPRCPLHLTLVPSVWGLQSSLISRQHTHSGCQALPVMATAMGNFSLHPADWDLAILTVFENFFTWNLENHSYLFSSPYLFFLS